MSTKTLRKRVALATAAALGAGVLTLVSTTAAHALAAGDMALGTGQDKSVGLVSGSITAGSLTNTGTLLSTGTLVLQETASATAYFKVSAGAYISGASNQAGIKSDQSAYTSASGEYFFVTPTGAPGTTFTVGGYSSSSSSTLVNLITITIASSSSSGVVSTSNSKLAWVSSNTDTATSDVSNKNSATTGNPLFLHIDLQDAYKADITSTTGALVVTATSGAYVNIAATGSTSKGSYSTAVSAASPDALWVQVNESTSGAGWAGSVSVTYNGTLVGTKAGTISGQPSKIVVTPKGVEKSGQTAKAYEYQAYDAAGNVVALATTLIYNASDNTAVVNGLADTAQNTTSTAGYGYLVCGISAGTANVSAKYTRTDGVVIVSNSWNAACGGDADSYTATFDKTVYNQGDIATLTVKFVDSKGNAANSYTAVSSSTNQTISAPNMTQLTAFKAAETVGATGTLVYKFTVNGNASGLAPGAYNAQVDFPTVNSNHGTTQGVAYTVSAQSGTSLNDVLKGIVSLIASINKQIAALAKLVTKK